MAISKVIDKAMAARQGSEYTVLDHFADVNKNRRSRSVSIKILVTSSYPDTPAILSLSTKTVTPLKESYRPRSVFTLQPKPDSRS